jgi:hypothetical protein
MLILFLKAGSFGKQSGASHTSLLLAKRDLRDSRAPL